MTLPLFACAKTAVPDEYTPLRAPEPVCDEAHEIGISVGSFAMLDSLLGLDFDLGAPVLSAGVTYDPERESYTASLKQGTSESADVSTFELLPESNFLGVDSKGDSVTDSLTEHELISRYITEGLVGSALDFISGCSVGYKYDADFLDKLGKYGTLEWEENYVDRTKTAILTLTGENIADFIEAAGEEKYPQLVTFFAALGSYGQAQELIADLRADEELSFTERLTLHASGRVLLADVRASGKDVLFSLAYDGSTGDVSVDARYKNKVSAEFSCEHADGRRTLSFIVKTAEREEDMSFIQTDGSVFFGFTAVGGKGMQLSFKYDKTEGKLGLHYNDLTLVLYCSDAALTGELSVAGMAKSTLSLTFDKISESELGVSYKLTGITTSFGDIDVSAADVRITVSKVN